MRGEAIERQPQEVLIKVDLRAFLAKQYGADHITPQEVEAVIKQLEVYSSADLYESNKAIMKLVSDGYLLKREAKHSRQPVRDTYKFIANSTLAGISKIK